MLLSIKKNFEKKVRVSQKLGQSGQKWRKLVKIGKKFVLYAFWPKKYIKNINLGNSRIKKIW